MTRYSIRIIRRNRRIVRAFLRSNTDLKRSVIRRMSYYDMIRLYSHLLWWDNVSRIYFGHHFNFSFIVPSILAEFHSAPQKKTLKNFAVKPKVYIFAP